MGIKIGRSGDAPVFETRKTARFGEQKVVATETPVEATREEVTTEVIDDDAKANDEAPVAVDKPAKAKRGRKPKK